MKIKEGFHLREICGEKVISPEGYKNVNFSKLITLNDTAAWLWENLDGKEFDAEKMADMLTEQYDVDRETALKDSQALCDKWLEIGIAE